LPLHSSLPPGDTYQSEDNAGEDSKARHTKPAEYQRGKIDML
jgi:hypothetical protein